MKAVLQRVKKSEVKVDGELVGSCEKGLMILLGVAVGDTEQDADALAAKILKLRIFEDENGKMNKSIMDIGGEALVVSQFTLLANYKSGNRPDYLASEKPERANMLYEYFSSLLRTSLSHVGNGVFGADMEVTIINDGPVTIVMDSSDLIKSR
ncbi:MAG: D-tyrosyl-tRNA(Tyr) deacylase [Clostridia bacterium]|nr:D-tyrosyl-tRNA(Tyr) deacylase [Clostridia bacterium]